MKCIKKIGGRAPPGPVEDTEALLQTSYAVVVAAGNVPSDSLPAVRGCFLLWREEREVEGDRDECGGSRRELTEKCIHDYHCQRRHVQFIMHKLTKLHKDAQVTVYFAVMQRSSS